MTRETLKNVNDWLVDRVFSWLGPVLIVVGFIGAVASLIAYLWK